jgi:hypothetical protein
MGYYVNPITESKESFLLREGQRVDKPDSYNRIPRDKALVVLVDNGMFTAAGVAYSQDEFEAFTDLRDGRRKSYFVVERDKLYPVSDITSDIFE